MEFIRSETGAVTVDWVVLTAALVGLGLATMGVVSSGVEDTSGDIDAQLKSTVIKTSFGVDPNYDAYRIGTISWDNGDQDNPQAIFWNDQAHDGLVAQLGAKSDAEVLESWAHWNAATPSTTDADEVTFYDYQLDMVEHELDVRGIAVPAS